MPGHLQAWLARGTRISHRTALGRALRMPLKMLPSGSVLPILTGPLKGAHWTVRSANLSCWLGAYELEKQRRFASSIACGDVVFDIGAHVGFYTLLAARLVGPAGRVVAFEPAPSNLAVLQRHVAINGLRNVKIVAAAVAETGGRRAFDPGLESHQGHLQSSGAIQVDSVQLDDEWSSGRLPRPGLVKIDVEGAEHDVLLGARRMLAECCPVVFLATHGTRESDDCVRLLETAGYSIERLNLRQDGEMDELIAQPPPGSESG